MESEEYQKLEKLLLLILNVASISLMPFEWEEVVEQLKEMGIKPPEPFK